MEGQLREISGAGLIELGHKASLSSATLDLLQAGREAGGGVGARAGVGAVEA